jgi:type I restriction enzyme R subunit
VLSNYVKVGVQELDRDKLAPLLRIRYRDSMVDAIADLGPADEIGEIFGGFQQYLYQESA